eukprot:scaffold120965_cov63-Phaeocystis_antarctica.AAC.3
MGEIDCLFRTEGRGEERETAAPRDHPPLTFRGSPAASRTASRTVLEVSPEDAEKMGSGHNWCVGHNRNRANNSPCLSPCNSRPWLVYALGGFASQPTGGLIPRVS